MRIAWVIEGARPEIIEAVYQHARDARVVHPTQAPVIMAVRDAVVTGMHNAEPARQYRVEVACTIAFAVVDAQAAGDPIPRPSETVWEVDGEGEE